MISNTEAWPTGHNKIIGIVYYLWTGQENSVMIAWYSHAKRERERERKGLECVWGLCRWKIHSIYACHHCATVLPEALVLERGSQVTLVITWLHTCSWLVYTKSHTGHTGSIQICPDTSLSYRKGCLAWNWDLTWPVPKRENQIWYMCWM